MGQLPFSFNHNPKGSLAAFHQYGDIETRKRQCINSDAFFWGLRHCEFIDPKRALFSKLNAGCSVDNDTSSATKPAQTASCAEMRGLPAVGMQSLSFSIVGMSMHLERLAFDALFPPSRNGRL